MREIFTPGERSVLTEAKVRWVKAQMTVPGDPVFHGVASGRLMSAPMVAAQGHAYGAWGVAKSKREAMKDRPWVIVHLGSGKSFTFAEGVRTLKKAKAVVQAMVKEEPALLNATVEETKAHAAVILKYRNKAVFGG